MSESKSKIVISFVFNLVALALPLVVLQLLVLPMMGRTMDGDRYGFVVAIFAFFSLIPGVLGNSLNNIRLIHESDWAAEEEGGFNLLQIVFAIIGAMAVAIYAALNGYFSVSDLVLIAATGLLWTMREYGCVAFLIDMDYRSVLLNSVVMSSGYLLGYVAFLATGCWMLVFFVGQVLSVAYIFVRTGLKNGGVAKSDRFGSLVRESLILSASTFVARSASYCDRVILYPLIGGASVAVYYSATLVPKLVNMIASSMNSVILSFLSKRSKIHRNELFLVLVASFAVCVVCYGIVMAIAPPILSLLYPQFAEAALPLLPIVTATAFVVVLSTIVSPYVLKFRPIRWQMIVSIVSLVFYLAAALVLLYWFGLIGFCIGALLAETGRFTALLMIFIFGKGRQCAE